MKPFPSARDLNLHPAFAPVREPDVFDPQVVVPQGNTSFDPLLGTGFGEMLDAYGAKSPRGARLRGGTLPRAVPPGGSTTPEYIGDPRRRGRKQLDDYLTVMFPGVK